MKDSLLKVYYPVKDYLLIILGTALYGFGYNAFILSNEIVTGGLSGICGLIFFATKLPVSVSYFAINVILLGIAFKILGFKFLIKTILGVASLSFWFWFFELVFAGKPLMQLQEVFMSVIIGAMICGSGLGARLLRRRQHGRNGHHRGHHQQVQEHLHRHGHGVARLPDRQQLLLPLCQRG